MDREIKKIRYPKTKTVDVKEYRFKREIHDPYRWLENIEDKKVKRWIKAQNRLTRSILDSLPGRRNIERELEKSFSKKRIGLPKIKKKKFFFYKHEKLKNQPILCLSHEEFNPNSAQVVIDPNEWSGEGIIALDWWFLSNQGRYIAFGRSKKGSEASILHILDVEKRKILKDRIPNTKWCSLVWLPDDTGFYYTRNTGGARFVPRVFLHRIGDDWENDKFIFGDELVENELPGVYASKDGRYLFLEVTKGWIKNDLYFKDLKRDTQFIPIAVGLDAKFKAKIYGEYVYILTNYKAPNWRIVRTDLNNPCISTAHEIIQESKRVIERFDIVGEKLLVLLKEDTYSRLMLFTLEGKRLYEIKMPQKGNICFKSSDRYEDPEIYYRFTSYLFPTSIYKFNVNTKRRMHIWRLETQFDIKKFRQTLVFYRSKDGAKIPMYILCKKEIRKDKTNPTILSGYGGFGIGILPYFRESILSWISRGGVYAVAGIRGGDEYGEDWHKMGMREHKQNVFDDFIKAAEYLIKKGYTNPQKLAIWGGSNGGLLVGAVMTQRPELFRAVICDVPLLDMLRFHRFGVAHIWTTEYGNPDKEEEFEWLYAYSPYHHVSQEKIYPAVLFTSGESEGRVHPMHAMKMAAKMQSIAKERPVLLYVEPKAGHGRGKPVRKQIKNIADKYVFLMWQLGVKILRRRKK